MASSATSLAVAKPGAACSGFAEFVVSARVELYACLQLLAERARFVTGADWVAIALREEEGFVYRAAAGTTGPELGSPASIKPLEVTQPDKSQTGKNSLIVSVIRDSRTEGFIELFSRELEFSDHDLQAVVRLSDLAATALDHMQAAERSEQVILAAKEPLKAEISLLWHAPEGEQPNLSRNPKPVDLALGSNVSTCQSCGFPVSQGRTICFDCEDRLGTVPPAPGLFHSERPASWLSVHGYTIASLAVTALVAAIIYWLR